MRSLLLMFAIVAIVSPASAQEWYHDQSVTRIGVLYGNGCITLSSGQLVKADLTTDKGRTIYSTALAALAAGQTLTVRFDTNAALVGGCDTGTTIRPIHMLQIRT